MKLSTGAGKGKILDHPNSNRLFNTCQLPRSFNQVCGSLTDNIHRKLRISRGNERLKVIRFEMFNIRMRLTKIDASTTRSLSIPFTLKSGSTTPCCAPCGDILAVATIWPFGDALARMKASSSASLELVVILLSGPSTYPSHARAPTNFWACPIPSLRANTSKSVVRQPKSIRG